MKILFLVPYPAGEAPSQRFRFEQYFGLLREHSIDYKISNFWSRRAWKVLYKPGFYFEKIAWLFAGFTTRWTDVIRSISFDIVFIHRECTPVGPPLCEFIISRILRKKIVYDFDDAIWLPNTSAENKIVGWIKFHSKVKSICRWSHRVSCGNNWLASYARVFNSCVVVNPTTIDTNQLHNPSLWPSTRQKGKLIIGWTGTHSTIIYLNRIIPILKMIENKYPIRIQIISNKNPNLDLKSAEFIPWDKEREIEQLLKFDIGLMPLDDDEWAKGKCGFKALQYMALGIPCVASPVGINLDIIDGQKNGLLCTSEKEWLDALETLIENPSLRLEIGIQGRKKVVANYSVDSNSTNFLSLTRL